MQSELDIFLQSLSKLENNSYNLPQQKDDFAERTQDEILSNGGGLSSLEKLDHILNEDLAIDVTLIDKAVKADMPLDEARLKVKDTPGGKDNQSNSKIDINVNHRDRVKNRFLESNSEVFQDYEIMEMILFFLIPRSDVKPLAKEMMHYFCSFDNLFKANDFEIGKFVSNIKNFRFFIELIREVNIRKIKSSVKGADVFLKKENLQDYCKEICFYDTQNKMYLLFLNKNEKIIGHFNFFEKDLQEEENLTKGIFEIILSKKDIKSIFIFKSIKEDENCIKFKYDNFLDNEQIFLTKFENIAAKFSIKLLNLGF